MTGFSMVKDVKVPPRPGMPAAYRPEPAVTVHMAPQASTEPKPEPSPESEPELVAERVEPAMPEDRRKRMAQASAHLRDMLFGELRDLRDGKSSPAQAQAVAKVSQQIVAALRLELELTTVTLPGSEPKLIEGA